MQLHPLRQCRNGAGTQYEQHLYLCASPLGWFFGSYVGRWALGCPGWTISATHTNFLQSELFSFLFLFSEGDYNGARRRAPLKPHSWVGSINFVNAAGLRPQDSAFVGLSNFPSFDWNHAGKERTKISFGFF